MHFIFISSIFEKKNWRTQFLSVGPLIPLFWASGDICLEIQSQGGTLACMLPRLRAIDSSDSSLVLHGPYLFNFK